ncbi:hypothetical protein IWX81_002101 [Salinibacterium sp. CAN_S4]|uniref:hypothetical protein n=1 Tax=Salinibacterium sp. CAN_S4 TaxID=2787727 RepID=UPI0018F015AF
MKNNTSTGRWTASLTMAAMVATMGLVSAPASAAPTVEAAPAALTNLAHLDFLLDTVSPADTAEHTTYELAGSPDLTVPWTYADARPGGTFERVGGGPFDPATGDYGQGAYNADDITRAAVVYLRHWVQTGSVESRDKAYELLRSVAYFQTVSGPNAGNVVLWMQSDGDFNPSPLPVELPDPSDSGSSYWLARTLWALGEGYAAFRDVDPEFSAFLQQRLQLGVEALDRQVLQDYGTYDIADGVSVPAWLINDGADISAEAVLGLAAYTTAAPDDPAPKAALSKLADGIAQLGSGDTRTWPYGAILPYTQSRSLWHAYASQMPAALAKASVALGSSELLPPAVADSAQFVPVLLTGGGPDNAWLPTPVDKTQIAYGVDSRLQSLLDVADAAQKPGLKELAGITAAWYFGANKSGTAVYDPTTGVTYDGVQADGSVNRNSGAESTIHGLLSMIALDANPDVAARALAATSITLTDGLTVVEAEDATTTTGAVVTPDAAYTGESQYSAGEYLELAKGESATIPLPGAGARSVEPVVDQPADAQATSLWRTGRLPIGVLRHSVGEQGITAVPGALLPQPLLVPALSARTDVTVTGLKGTVDLDALIVRPLLSRLTLGGESASTELVNSAALVPLRASVGAAGQDATVRSYDRTGTLVEERTISGASKVTVRAGGFVVVTR